LYVHWYGILQYPSPMRQKRGGGSCWCASSQITIACKQRHHLGLSLEAAAVTVTVAAAGLGTAARQTASGCCPLVIVNSCSRRRNNRQATDGHTFEYLCLPRGRLGLLPSPRHPIAIRIQIGLAHCRGLTTLHNTSVGPDWMRLEDSCSRCACNQALKAGWQ